MKIKELPWSRKGQEGRKGFIIPCPPLEKGAVSGKDEAASSQRSESI